MFQRDKFQLSGHISRTHSFKGEVVLQLDGYSDKEFRAVKEFFVEIDGNLVPFFPEKIHSMRSDAQRSSAVIKFQDVGDQLIAARLSGCDIWLPVTKKAKVASEKAESDMIGYDVDDLFYGFIGKVSALISEGGNPLLQVDQNGKEILIPWQPQFIRGIDPKEKKIFLTAPEGLISFYLDGDDSAEI